MKFIENGLKRLDIVGYEVKFRFKGYDRVKSGIGGLFTLITIVFAMFCFIYFGRDLIEKKKPISRLTRELKSAELLVSDVPQAYLFINRYGTPLTNVERYITILPRLFKVRYDTKEQRANMTELFFKIEPCTPESFGKYKDIFTDPNYNFPYKQATCVKTDKYFIDETLKEYNGEDEVAFNEFASFPSNVIFTLIHKCLNGTYTGQVCAPREEIDMFLEGISIGFYTLDYFIDLNNLESPKTPIIYSYMQSVISKMSKNTYFTFKNTIIQTDTSLLFENVDRVDSFFQVGSIKNDISYTDYSILNIYVDVNRVSDIYNRNYVKIQDILAAIGGLLKFILNLSTIITSFLSKKIFISEISNNSFKVNNTIKKIDLINKDDSSNILKNINFPNSLYCDKNNISINDSNIKIADNNKPRLENNFVNEKNSDSYPLNLSVSDFIKTKLKCKSKYKAHYYNILEKFVFNDLEIQKLFSNSLLLNKLSKTLIPDDLENDILISKLDQDLNPDDSRDCSIIRKSISQVLIQTITEDVKN